MDTLWRKVHNLYTQGTVEWWVGEPVALRNGRPCMCIGGAIAYVLYGNPETMYNTIGTIPEALTVFADHVNALDGYTTVAERVYKWNDKLSISAGRETVLLALEELDSIARTECQHIPYLGACILCGCEYN